MSLLDDSTFTTRPHEGTIAMSSAAAVIEDEPREPSRYPRGPGAELTLDVQKMSGFSLRRKKSQRQSKTPPDSPKSIKSEVGRKGAGMKGGGGANKGGRKQYATLMENDSNGEDDEDDDFFLLSKGHIAKEKRTSSIAAKSNLSSSEEVTTPTTSVVNPLGSGVERTINEGFPVRFTPPNEARFPNFEFGFDNTSNDIFNLPPSFDNVIDDTSHVILPPDHVTSIPPPDQKGHVIIPPPSQKGHMTIPPPDQKGQVSIPPPDQKGHVTIPPPDQKGHMTIPPPDQKSHMTLNPSVSIGFSVLPDHDQHAHHLTLPPPSSSLPPLAIFQPSPPQVRQTEETLQLQQQTTPVSMEDSDWSISDELYQKCTNQFHGLFPENGYLSGEKARDFFLRSNLPVEELSKIWKLSDIDRDGKLTQDEFVIAMKLVLMRRKKYDIPSTLPEPLKIKDKKLPVASAVPPPITMTTRPESEPIELENSVPLRPPPPTFLTSSHRAKTEPSIAVSGATPTATPTSLTLTPVEHLSGKKPYTKVNNNNKINKRKDDENLILASDGYESSDMVTPTEQVDVSLEPRPLEPAVARLVSVDTGEDTTGDEDETAVLVAGATVSADGKIEAPVPKPRKKRRSPHQSKEKVPINELHRSHTIHGRGPSQAPPRPPAPYKGRSPLHIAATSVSTSEQTTTSSSTEEIAPMVTKTSEIIKENSNKGHGRSTSWDLTKMLKDHAIGVHEDLPSAEPPKLPPRRNISPSSDDESSSVTANKSQSVSTLQRSASTGSIASVGLPISAPLKNTSRSPSIDSGNLLLAAETLLPPRAATVSDSNRRPAPAPPTTKPKPAVPKKPLFPPSYKKVTTPIDKPSETDTKEKSPLSMEMYKKKTKMELQMSVKQLKDENEVYRRMNKELSQKLQELIDQRTKLQVKLDSFRKQGHTH